MSGSSPLYGATYHHIDAKTALKKVWTACESAEKPFLLAYSPSICCFAKFEDESIVLPTEAKNRRADDIFELRCFCEEYELRWVRDGGKDEGKAVLLADNKHNEVFGADLKGIDYVFSHSGQYLLWGMNNETGSGETIFFEHRVGSLRVPIETCKNRAYLHFREYFSEDDYGNLVWLTERCLTLKEEPYRSA